MVRLVQVVVPLRLSVDYVDEDPLAVGWTVPVGHYEVVETGVVGRRVLDPETDVDPVGKGVASIVHV